MNTKVYLRITERNANGKIINRTKWQPLNSMVKAFIDIFYLWSMSATTTMTDTSNTSRSFTIAAIDNTTILAAASDATHGIVVGTGTNAVAIGDYALQTLIAQGTGAGQLSYGNTAVASSLTTSGSTRYFSINRPITNNSGGNITVNEVGAYVKNTVSTWYFCIERSLNTYTINNGSVATYEYKFTLTV